MNDDGEGGGTSQRITPVGSITQWLRGTWEREPSENEHASIDELIPQGGIELAEYVVRFSFLIVLSAAIAGFGLLADSAGVVIGAMLGRTAGGLRSILQGDVTEAGEPMFDDPPGCAMYKQASFAESWLPDGVEIGDDVDLFVLPGSDPDDLAPMLVSADGLVQFSDDDRVDRLMVYLVSPDGGRSWAEPRPVRHDDRRRDRDREHAVNWTVGGGGRESNPPDRDHPSHPL